MADAKRSGGKAGQDRTRVAEVTIAGKRYGVNLTLGTVLQWQRAGFTGYPDVSDVEPFLPPGKRPAKRLLFTLLEERMSFAIQVKRLAELASTRTVARAKAELALAAYAANKLGWICIDCGYDSMMKVSELKSLREQVGRGYACCRALPVEQQPPMVLTSVTQEFLVQLLHSNAFAWSLRITSLPCNALYLGSESGGGASTLPSPLDVPDLRDAIFDATGRVTLEDHTKQPGTLARLAGSLQAAVLQPTTSRELATPGPAATPSSAASASAASVEPIDAIASSASEAVPLDTPIYLTADGTDALSAEDAASWPKTGTIVGGLVDRNRYPGAALRRAQEMSARPVRLPIEEFSITARSRVLTVVAVFEIITARLIGRPWRDVLSGALPTRPSKRLALKSDDASETLIASSTTQATTGPETTDAKRSKPAV